MDKYEYKIRADEIKRLISQGDYVQAAEIADTIDWRRVKSVMMLCTISDLYKINRRFEDAKDMLLLAYERRPRGRTICYSLCELSIKTGEFTDAVEYYKEFVQVAPKDPGRYILQYKIYESSDVTLEERIAVLEELKKYDYREKWAYELAYLYHRMGLETRCVEECDALILWFGEGKYVMKAMELKKLHQPLTPEQQEKYDHRFDPPQRYPKQPSPKEAQPNRQVEGGYASAVQPTIPYPVQPAELNYEIPVQPAESNYETPAQPAEPYAGQYPEEDYASAVQPAVSYPVQSAESNYETPAQPAEPYAGQYPEEAYEEASYPTEPYADLYPEEGYEAVEQLHTVSEQEEELDIHVKMLDMGQYNTINLQEELAAGLQEILEKEQAASVEKTNQNRSLMLDMDTESLDYPEIDEVSEEDLEPVYEEMEATEVFFGETGEITKPSKDKDTVPDIVTAQRSKPTSLREPKASGKEWSLEELVAKKTAAAPVREEPRPAKEAETQAGESFVREEPQPAKEAETQAGESFVREEPQPEKESGTQAWQNILPVEPPKEIANVLAQESDGQLSLVMPEKEQIEKQITGQMNIEDILAEWERIKQEQKQQESENGRKEIISVQENGRKAEAALAPENGQKAEPAPIQEVHSQVTEEDDIFFEELEIEQFSDLGEVEELEEIVEEETILDSDTTEEKVVERPTGEMPKDEATMRQELADMVNQLPVIELGRKKPQDADYEETMEELRAAANSFEQVMQEAEAEAKTTVAPEKSTAQEVLQEEPVTEAEAKTIVAPEKSTAQEVLQEEPVTEVEAKTIVAPEKSTAQEVLQEEPVTEAEAKSTVAPEKSVVGDASSKESQKVPVQLERDKARIRELTREEKELYAPFIQSRAAREQLVRAIDNITLASYTGNVIITGEEGMDISTLARNMIRELQAADSNFSGKVGKITGKTLNDKDLKKLLEELKNGALIIMKASGMDEETLHCLTKLLLQDKQGIVVVMLDTAKKIDKLLKKQEELQEIFTARMDVEALSNDTLAAFGRRYARELEYSIDEVGMLALHTRIAERQTIDHVVTVMEVKEIVDKAIRHVNRKTLGHFCDILFARRYDDEDMIVLSEKDFE